MSDPRLITASEVHRTETLRAIDLGLVNLRDLSINGRNSPLIPYADGRLIKSVRFVRTPPGSYNFRDATLCFVTPNTASNLNSAGGGFAGCNSSDIFDTLGIINIGYNSMMEPESSGDNQILDCGPLTGQLGVNLPIGSWQANTRVVLFDQILDSNGHVQAITVNGVTGSTEPAWNNSGGTTSDGSVTWADNGNADDFLPSGEIHLVAEVIEGISPMPPYPASIEFVAPPANTVAGETMADVTVIVKDQNGELYLLQPGDVIPAPSITLGIYGAGTLNGTTFQEVSTGSIATFSGLSITEPGTGYVIRAWMSPTIVAEPIYSPPFNITAP